MADYTAKRVDELEGFYKGLFLKARAELGVQSFGMAVVELDPGSDAHPDHDHSAAGQEEVFVVLRGTGEITVDGETVALDPETIVRCRPGGQAEDHPRPGGHAPHSPRRRPGQGLRGARLHRVGGARPVGVTSGR